MEWKYVVDWAKGAGVPVLAFGRHTEPHLLRSAREADCTRVVPRSTFVEQLPQLIDEVARATKLAPDRPVSGSQTPAGPRRRLKYLV